MTASTQGPQESVANGRWHALDAESVLRELATSEKGLTGEAAATGRTGCRLRGRAARGRGCSRSSTTC